jgi:two-component system, cell cycle response regulator CpdR
MTSPDGSPGDASRISGGVGILVVDDEQDLLTALSGTLRRAGFRVRTATSAQSGLDALEREAVEVVITDIIMPRTSGIDVIAQVRMLYPRTRVIAISGGGNFGPFDYQTDSITTCAYLAASERHGAHAVLAKPFEAWEIIAAVHQVLGH